jgi:hypothetical protein
MIYGLEDKEISGFEWIGGFALSGGLSDRIDGIDEVLKADFDKVLGIAAMGSRHSIAHESQTEN